MKEMRSLMLWMGRGRTAFEQGDKFLSGGLRGRWGTAADVLEAGAEGGNDWEGQGGVGGRGGGLRICKNRRWRTGRERGGGLGGPRNGLSG